MKWNEYNIWGLPLGWALGETAKQKIWINQYVELEELPDQSSINNYSVSVDPESGS